MSGDPAGGGETVRIDLGPRSYDIRIGGGLIAEAGRIIAGTRGTRPVVTVTDENVAALHLPALEASLADAGIANTTLVLPAGEETKQFATLQRLLDDILDTRPERGSAIVALGGGVIGDIAGFAASIVLRGIDYVQIPTTLLAQVDSSVGGKTAIDTRHGKNLVGAFHQPRLVLADTGALATLPGRELRAGYAEVAKYGLIVDAPFFGWLEANAQALLAGDREAQARAVAESVRTKARIVAADEREEGERALLNFGHTFGHALEAEAGFGDALLHGEAVAIGMVMAFDLSVRLGLCPAADAARARRHLDDAGLPTGLSANGAWDTARLLQRMAQDKKVRDGRITFILTRGIGRAFIARDVETQEVAALLAGAVAA